jgi:pimeloyl-ACP methyl ester carboxylesterase
MRVWRVRDPHVRADRCRGDGVGVTRSAGPSCSASEIAGSDSPRNAERQGFRIARTRVKWRQMVASNVMARALRARELAAVGRGTRVDGGQLGPVQRTAGLALRDLDWPHSEWAGAELWEATGGFSRRALSLALVVGLMATPARAAAQSVGEDQVAAASFEPEPCPFWSADESARYRVECGKLIVPESEAGGRRYRLQVAILRSLRERLHNEAIVVLPGGPGGDLIRGDAARLAQHPLQDALRQHRDIVLMDPRGTGYSEPGELCPAFGSMETRAAILRLQLDERTAVVRRELEACRARLQEQRIDPSQFNSVALARDLEGLRHALGYGQLNLIGLSWGTRVVLETMRRFPESVRSAILFGPWPAGVPWHVMETRAGDSLERLFRQCAADARCQSAFPALEQEFHAMLTELDADPIRLSTRWGRIDVDGALAQTVVTYAFYDSGFLPYIPLTIRELRRRHAAFVEVFLGAAMGGGVSGGFYYAASCFELPPPFAPDAVHRLRERYPWLGRADRLAPDLAAVCASFIQPSADSTVFQPVRSDVPTVIFVGEFDSTTPPEYGRLAAATLPNAHLLQLPAKGHNVNVPTPCTAQIRARFLDDPLEPPDTACLATLPPLSFATDVHANAGVPRLLSHLAVEREPAWIAGIVLLLFSLLLGAVLLPLNWLGGRGWINGRGATLATALVWAAAATGLLFAVGLAVALWTAGDPYLLLFGVPDSWRWLFVLPALAIPLAAAGLIAVGLGWRRDWWSPRSRVLHAVTALAGVAFSLAAVWVGLL